MGSHPELGIGIGLGSVWIADTKDRSLTRLDPVSGKVTANIKVKPKSHAATVAFGSVWVTSSGDGTVERVDPRTNLVSAEIRVHASPRFLAAGADSLWVLSQGDGTLARIDPRTNRVVVTVAVGVPGEGGDLSIGEDYVWVSAEGVPLSQIDLRTNELIRQYVGGSKDDTLRVGFGSAWIVEELTGQIWRVSLEQLNEMGRKP